MFAMPPQPWDTDELSRLDKRHVWHPFTPMADWLAEDHEPVFLTGGEGAWLFDSRGRRYLDGNSSIWTNIHGHAHPKLSAAIAEQASTLPHSSFLGFSNPWAVRLASRLAGYFHGTKLQRVFFTDNGSTAIESALKMSIQCRQLRGEMERLLFGSFASAYHGDTLGASSLGGVSAFTERFSSWGWQPLRFGGMDDLRSLEPSTIERMNAVVIEPLIQGVNRMHLWPKGMLRELRDWCDAHGVFLILDEVLTGFGRTGRMFACQHEDVVPDFLCLAKGLTGGTLPLAATLVNEDVFSTFLGDPGDPRTFYYGHSYCGNPLGCAAALASLDLFDAEGVLDHFPGKETTFADSLRSLRSRCGNRIGGIRQLGLVAGVDVVDGNGMPFPQPERMGGRVCESARRFGLLTRPILDTIVLMPPLCIQSSEIRLMVESLALAIEATVPPSL
jgi:adenosylmethionine-8-amino-7-oxononanoate aminotransferase